MKLPSRLAALAALVPEGARIADIGTDHGLLPIYLMRQGVVPSAIATDIREGPLSRARSNAAAYGETRIRFVLCDGLAGLSAEDADTVVIAGMGGENIAEILAKAPWVRQGSLLILQPMSRPETLRHALWDMSLAISHEELVEDGGRIYPVLTASAGECEPYTAAEYYVGRLSQIRNDPLFPHYLRQLCARLTSAAAGLEQSQRIEDAARLAALREIIEELKHCEEDES